MSRRPTHLNSQQYSNIRQSLRNMPPVNPPLPRHDTNTDTNNAQPHNLRDLFSGKVGIIRNPLRRDSRWGTRKHLPPKTPQGRRGIRECTTSSSVNDVSSSSLSPHSSRSRTGTSSSYSKNHHLTSSNTDSNQTYSYHSSSVSDYYTEDDNNILDADVRHTHDASTYAHTFDFNYADQFNDDDDRPTFDYDYTQPVQHQPSQRLVSLQQHLEEKSFWEDAQLEKYRHEEVEEPPVGDDESWRTDALVSQHVAMEQALQQSSNQSEQLKSPPEELYANENRNSSIGDNIDQGLLNDIIRSIPQGGDHGNGEEQCDLSVLKEMGLRTSSNKPLLPEWILNDVLEAQGDVDPEVLKELVVSTVSNERSNFDKPQLKSDQAVLRRQEEEEDVRGMRVTELRKYVIKDTDDHDHDRALLKKKEFVETLINDDTSSVGITLDRIDSGIDDHRKIPMEEEILHETHDGKIPSIPVIDQHGQQKDIAIDDLGPIPPATNGILGNSLTSMVESHPDSQTDDTVFFGNSFVSIGAESHPTVTTIEEDTRGPIPTDDIIGCAWAKSSITVSTGSAKEDHPDTKIEDRKMQSELIYTKGGSVGSSSASYNSTISRGESSSYGGATKDSTPCSGMSDTYSDQKLSLQSTAQSSSIQSQSASYYMNNRARSTIEYPSDEETLKRPTIRCSSSVSEECKSIPTDAAETKLTLDNKLLPKDDMPKLPSLRYPRRSSSFSFSDDQEVSHHTKPSLGFLKRRRHTVHPCLDEDVQATTMKMRRDLLESMKLKAKAALQVHERRKALTILNPINI